MQDKVRKERYVKNFSSRLKAKDVRSERAQKLAEE